MYNDHHRMMDRNGHHQNNYQSNNNNNNQYSSSSSNSNINYGVYEQQQPTSSSSSNQQRSSSMRNGGSSSATLRKSSSSPPPRYSSSLIPDFDIGPPQLPKSSYLMSSKSAEPSSRTATTTNRKSKLYSSDLPPSYESSVVSPLLLSSPSMMNNNDMMMESKRREYLQQKLTHLKKQNTTSMEHFNIVRDDVRQSKEMMEKQIMQQYGAMKQRLELLLQDSLRTLQDLESDLTEPLDTKLDQLKKNLRSIDMTESILSRQPYSESVKEKVDTCLKVNLPPFASDVDVCKLTDQNNFSLLVASSSFLADGSGIGGCGGTTFPMKQSRGNTTHPPSSTINNDMPRYESKYFDREKDLKYSSSDNNIGFKEREKKNNMTRNIPPTSYDGYDDYKSDDLSPLNDDHPDFDYPRNNNYRNGTTAATKEQYQASRRPNRNSPDSIRDGDADKQSISDSVIGSYHQLEDLYSQTKNFAVFKGANF